MPADNLERIFPQLVGATYAITSPEDGYYNCIAWAANDIQRKWWPFAYPPQGYWPDNIPREETVAAFAAAFATLGYGECDNGDVEEGFEKVAIYTDADGEVTHMARQLENGTWASKLGDLEDIEHHTVDSLNGSAYGQPRQYLRRQR
jgi:hypothetical protein